MRSLVSLCAMLLASVSFSYAGDFYPDAQAKYRVERSNYDQSAAAIQSEVSKKIADLQVLIDQYEDDKRKCTSPSCEKRIEDNIALLKSDQVRAQEAGTLKTVQLTRAFVSNANALASVAFLNEALVIIQSDPSITDVRVIRNPFPLPDGFDACTRTGGRSSRIPSFRMACREMTVEFLFQSRYYRTRLAAGLLDLGYAHNGMEAPFDFTDAVARKDALYNQNQSEFMRNVTAGYLLFGTPTGRPNWIQSDTLYYWFGSESMVGTTRLY